MKRRHLVLVLVFAFVAIAALLAVGGGASKVRPAEAAEASVQAKAIPVAARSLVSSAVGRHDSAYHAVATGSTLRVANKPNALRGSFSRDGLSVKAAGTSLELALTAYGRPGALASVNTVAPRSKANRVEYRRGPLTEWYLNGPLGLEQGFTLRSAPSGARGTLSFDLRLASSSSAIVAPSGRGVSFAGSALRYQGLFAKDAKGRSIPATMTVRGSQLRINVNDRNATYPLVVDPFVQIAKLTSEAADPSGNLGVSVAMSDSLIVAGAPGFNGGTGAVFVFDRPTDGWANANENAMVQAPGGSDGDNFGASVALDGSTIAVGAPSAKDAAGVPSGAVYVFHFNSDIWAYDATLTPTGSIANERYGSSVALSGQLLVVGAPSATGTGDITVAGRVFVYNDADTWSSAQLDVLEAPTPAQGEHFGSSVAVNHGDTDTIVVGSTDSVVNDRTTGSAYVFTGVFNDYAAPAQLTASDAASGDGLGAAVALNGDTIVASAPGVNNHAGEAYVFLRGTGWTTRTEDAQLNASDGAGGANFGESLALNGNTIVVGAPTADPGKVYVFDRPTDQSDPLNETQFIATGGDDLGVAVGIDSNGDVTGTADGGAGVAYVFQLQDGPPPPPENSSPTANDDSAFATPNGGAVTIDVLANDSDPDEGDTIQVTSDTPSAAHGSVTCDAQSCDYTPDEGYLGPDSFDYTISDSHEATASATVSVAVDTAPVANDDSLVAQRNGGSASVDVTDNDTDADEGDTLSVSSHTEAEHGSVSCEGPTCTYFPNENYSGPDSFQYTVTDSQGATASATVNVTVNSPPVANDDTAETTPNSGGVSVDVLANDSDPDEGDTISISDYSDGAHGSVSCEGQTCNYSPNPEFFGSDSFTYEISDSSGATATATVDVTVNTPPVANDDTLLAQRNAGAASIDVLANDSDPDPGDTFSITAHTDGAHGFVGCEGPTCSYTPDEGYSGPDSFQYTITDSQGATATATVSVTVNSPPVANDDTAVALANGGLITIPVTDNDSDPEGDAFSITSSTLASHGVATCAQGGQSCTYRPAAEYVGPDSFTYTISDSSGLSATATVNIIVNAPPVAKDDIGLAAANGPALVIGVIQNDTDPGDSIRVISHTDPAHGTVTCDSSNCNYTPAVDYVGPDSFTYTISDSLDATATATVNLTVAATVTRNTLPAQCGQSIINFDDVSSQFVDLTDRYASRGVHFGPTVLSLSANRVVVAGAVTHSPPMSAYQSGGSGGVPLVINFDQPQRSVGYYIGNAPYSHIDAVLTAYDAAGHIVGTTTQGIDGDSVTTFIGLSATAPVISRLSLDYGGTPQTEEIDDLCFDGLSVAAPAPALLQAVPGDGSTKVVGRLHGAPTLPYTISYKGAPSCVDGKLGPRPFGLGSATATTDANGDILFTHTVGSVPAGNFVQAVATADGFAPSAVSNCIEVGPDNDVWPRALKVNPATGPVDQTQHLDQLGQARWYYVDVQPNSQVTLDLSGMAQNYDLFVFKDIGAAFKDITSPQDLTQLAAEFAGDATAPSAFSPSAFSPSAFSPSAFSPSAFSPSAFSPSAFSPSAFSPSAFSPSAFSPSAFSDSAYSSAQVRSLIGGSASEGSAPEHITLNTWNNTRLYFRVNGRNGAFDTSTPFDLHVGVDSTICNGIAPSGSAPPAVGSLGKKTVILTDTSRFDPAMTSTEKTAFLAKLNALAGRPDVAGDVVDLAGNSRVSGLNTQADTHLACPYAKNLVAGAVKDVVDSYRKNNPLKYVVIAGNDKVIPFFRYPDTAGLGPELDYFPPVKDTSGSQASLRLDYVLSQDAYGSLRQVSLKDAALPVPDLAVGRLVETPSEITGMIDSYLGLTNGVVPTPTSSLVTGYDFLADAASTVQSQLKDGLAAGARTDTLITNNGVSPSDVGDAPLHSWDADRLRTKLFGSRHDLIFLGGHFSANNTLAADFSTTVNSTEVASSTTNFQNSIIWSAGCHSGYNIVDPDAIQNVTSTLDWVEAFAQKQATLIAGTGYQYGDTDFVEYSERLYSDFARNLRLGTGPVSVGQALLLAKQHYLNTTPQMLGIHQKALLEATLFGLPMLSVNMPGTRLADNGTTPLVSATSLAPPPGSQLNLRLADVTVPTPTDLPAKTTLLTAPTGSVTASYLTSGGAFLTNPGQPTLPLITKNVTPPDADYVLRGVGFRGGTFSDSTGVTPLVGAPATELGGVHTSFPSPTFFPSRLWSVNYYDALARNGGSTELLITPAQYKTDGPSSPSTDTQRTFSNLSLRFYYSKQLTGAVLAAPPALSDIETTTTGSTVHFSVHVVGDPAAGIEGVWITYFSNTGGQWQPLDLAQDPADSTLWTGTLTGVTPGAIHYVVQAVNGLGLVTLDDNFGAYYTPGSETNANDPTSDTGSIQATSLSLSAPSSGVNATNATVSADLKHGSLGIAGMPVVFSVGGFSAFGFTDAAGHVTTQLPLTALPGSYQLTAGYAGDATHAPASATAPFTIQRHPTALALPASSTVDALNAGPSAKLTYDSGKALAQKTVLFVVRKASDNSIAARVARITDPAGNAPLGLLTLPVGSYTVDAYFGGTIGDVNLGDPTPYSIATAHGTLSVVFTFSGFFSPVDNAPVINVAKAGQAIPVKFGVGSNAGLNLFADGYPKVVPVSCDAGAPTDAIDTTVSASANNLSYDASSQRYNYVWKTDSAFAGTCKQLVLRFKNGAERSANFQFKK